MNHWNSIIHDGHLYGIYEFKKYGRAPKCIDLATGEIKWSHPGFGPGNVILAGDKLVVPDAGEVALVVPNPTPTMNWAVCKRLGASVIHVALSDGKSISQHDPRRCFDLKPKNGRAFPRFALLPTSVPGALPNNESSV